MYSIFRPPLLQSDNSIALLLAQQRSHLLHSKEEIIESPRIQRGLFQKTNRKKKEEEPGAFVWRTSLFALWKPSRISYSQEGVENLGLHNIHPPQKYWKCTQCIQCTDAFCKTAHFPNGHHHLNSVTVTVNDTVRKKKGEKTRVCSKME